MHILIPMVIGGFIGLALSFLYVYVIQGNERRFGIVALGTAIGGITGAAIAWWLTS